MQIQSALPDGLIIALCVVAMACCAGIASRTSRTAMRNPAWLATGLAAGFAYAAIFAHYRLADELPLELEGRDVEVVGTVSSLPQFFARGVRFEFTVEQVLTSGARVPTLLQLSWYGGFAAEARTPDPAVRPGERWLLNVRLKRPHGGANPHVFDYEAWLLVRPPLRRNVLRAILFTRPR